ncbi:hypothetical protein NA56DRAFT_749896 [Hyaloscypha hepaticicola]|uniref:BHLH domain-containing protein n=1 Tax=Hyaloscypha hepaticicola TaxID=2082293 RepID=A0A2J6Q2E9_9HELO|nr:hypothetical protein NA56DRAFT_749896 [Hyaloscypha hepaticicola]
MAQFREVAFGRIWGRRISFGSGYTESIRVSQEEPLFASEESQPFDERMIIQGELMTSASDTSQISTSSFGLYTPNSDSNLFDQSFAASLEESYPADIHPNGEDLGILQDDSRAQTSHIWISDSRNLATAFSDTTMQEKLIWDSSRDSTSTNTAFENFNASAQTTPPTTNINGARGESCLDTTRMRTCTRNSRPNVRQATYNSERRHSSPKLRIAHISRSSTSPKLSHTKVDLKRAHNMVEKQYRNRLNGGFASLLAKIPSELAASSGLETGGKNVSKAGTLALAERYIMILQEEGKDLVKKNKRLEEDYDRLRRAWINSGGVLIP